MRKNLRQISGIIFTTLLLVGMGWFGLDLAWGEVTFTDVSDLSGVGAVNGLISWPFGAMLEDIDNDGDLDLFIMNHSASEGSRLLRNNGNFNFTDISNLSGIWQGVNTGNSSRIIDLNGDGFSEIIVTSADLGGVTVYQNEGNNVFSHKGKVLTRPAGGIGFGDFDGDQDLDFYTGVSNPNFEDGHPYLCTDYLKYTYQQASLLPDKNCFSSALFVDLNNDNLNDVYLSQYSYVTVPTNNIYLNQGGGGFTDFTSQSSLAGNGTTNAVFFDIDNDADLDALFLYPLIKLYENDGLGHFTDITAGSGLSGGYNNGQAKFVDFDNDGFLDFVTGGYWCPNRIYRNLGNKTFQNLTSNSGLPTDKSAFADAADLDNDGDVDIILSGPSNGSKYVAAFSNNLNNDNWLKVKTVGVSPNTNALGAKIWVYQTGYLGNNNYLNGYRQVQDTGGLIQHFGLSSSQRYDVRVRFSSGNVVEETNVATAQTLTIQETSSSTLNITTVSLPGGIVGSPYSQAIVAQGGQPPYSWSIVSGALTVSLSLSSSSGVISGNPATAGDFSFTVQVQDSASPSNQDTQNLSISIREAGGELIFTDITALSGIGNIGYLKTWTSALGDVDNDSNPDLVLGTIGYGTRLYRNLGNFIFSSSAEIITNTNSQAVGFIDINNDGELDIFAGANLWASVEPYINDGSGNFTKMNWFPDNLTSVTISLGDFENDGDLDVGVGNDAQNTGSRWFRNNGNNVYTEVSDPPYRQGTGALIMADLNGDNLTDIYAGHWWFGEPGGIGYILMNKGGGHFEETQRIGDPILKDGTSYAGVADIDNDGDMDIVNGHPRPKLFINDGAGYFTEATNTGLPNTTLLDGASPHFVDFDHDGWIDILMPGEKKIYRNLGNYKFQDITASVGLNPSGLYGSSVMGDIDNDGDIDLLSLIEDKNKAYRNELNGNNWLKVKVEGSLANISAVGAKVWVYSNGYLGNNNYLQGYREVLGGASHQVGSFLNIQHFGLNSAFRYDIRVRFPDGAIVDILNVTTGQTLLVTSQGMQQKLKGDVNGDGLVNVVDVQLAVNQFLGVLPQTQEADLNGDGVVNVIDVQLVVNIILGG